MKKHNKSTTTSLVKRFPRLFGAGVLLVIVFLTVGVVAGISKQTARSQESNQQEGSIPVASAAKTRMTNSQNVIQTGQIKPLTPEEAQRLAAALKELANQSADGLRQVQHADGSVSMDLQGRFQNVVIAKRNEDGSVSESCIDNPESGAAFFGLDPTLVGVKIKNGAATSTKSVTHK